MKIQDKTKRITFTALFTAMTVVLSSFSIPVPGGHLYLNDTVICLAAMLLDPVSAFVVGGVGAFLGDFFFYPAPMFVSLVTHGLQAVVISLIANSKAFENKRIAGDILAVLIGAVIMVTGYTFGRAYVYANWETSMVKLPFECVQAGFGAVCGLILYHATSLTKNFKLIAGK